MVAPGVAVVAEVVEPAATEAGLSFWASSRKLRTPFPSWPRTSGSLPAPKTISTTARMRRSSGPPIFGTSITPLARRRGARDVFSQSTDVAVPLNEEAVEQTDEERDDDQQHERWQIAQDEDQHQ